MAKLSACKFHRATITGKSGVITSSGAYAGISFGPNEHPIRISKRILHQEYNIKVKTSETGELLMKQLELKTLTNLPGKTLLLTYLKDEAFSHFIFEVLSILSIAESLRYDINMVVSPDILTYQMEMIYACGIPASRIIIKDRNIDILCEELFVINSPGKNNGWISDPAMRFIRTKFHHYAESGKHLYKKEYMSCNKYYIDRDDDRSSFRTIENESELKEIAVRHGFRVVTPGKMNLQEKIIFFRHAKYIIGQYGGGLQLALIGRKRASILVIQSPHFVRHQMSIMDRFLNHCILNIHGVASKHEPRVFNNAPFHVQPELFKASVTQMLSERNGKTSNAPFHAQPELFKASVTQMLSERNEKTSFEIYSLFP